MCACPRLNGVSRVEGSRLGVWSRVFTVKLQNMLFLGLFCVRVVH